MPFIFSRRYIQNRLNILRGVLTEEQHKSLVARLNKRAPDRLAAMWEAVVLAYFSKLPDFKHECPLEDGRKPDFQYVLPKSKLRVVGDITGVSDAGAKKANSVNDFFAEFAEVVAKLGSDMSQFHVRVGDKTIGQHNKQKVELQLPRKADRPLFFKSELRPYIKQRLMAQDYGHKKVFDDGNYNVEVVFQRKSQYAMSGYASFTSARNIDNNPIWNSLKAKAEQLKRTPAGAIRLLVLCDCDCDSMRGSEFSQNISHHDIINDFLRRKTGIDIVIALAEVTIVKVLQQPKRKHYGEIFVRQSWIDAKQSNRAAVAELTEILDELLDRLPESVSNVETATRNCNKFDYNPHGTGGVMREGNSITISARELQLLLAGEISVEEFDKNASFDVGHRFSRALSTGSTISDVSLVSRGEHADDDRLKFTFSPDAARLPFE